MLWFKKAPESEENGGGVGKAGMPVSEREERRGGGVEEEEKEEEAACASLAVADESTERQDWLTGRVTSAPVRGSSEDAPLSWEGTQSGVCT